MLILDIPSIRKTRFILVDCGARELSLDQNISRAFPNLTLVGFEPDKDECARLDRMSNEQRIFFPVAVGERDETRTLHLTRSPECSSLLLPNVEFFGKFHDTEKSVEVVADKEVQVVSLDKYLPSSGISQIDFLKLDVQGVELEILRGSGSFLRSGILGMLIEVEFSPIYQNQPLFADVDNFTRTYSFMLFDLSRVYYRRKVMSREIDTRGQLVYGDALYLRDYRYFVERSMKLEAMKLAVLASAYGFHDYALEIVQFLLGEGNMLTDTERADLEKAHRSYRNRLTCGRSTLETLLQLRIVGPLLQKATNTFVVANGRIKRRRSAWAD